MGWWRVKRSGPLTRTVGLTASAATYRAWQDRSRLAAIARRAVPAPREPKPRSGRRPQRRNDSQWRADCLEVRGEWCRVPDCPHPMPVQMDHLIPRAQGGPSVVQNGLPLCRMHHRMKTDHLLLIAPEWLDADMIVWLADEGHAEWLKDSVVVGRHCRIFADGTPDRSLL